MPAVDHTKIIERCRAATAAVREELDMLERRPNPLPRDEAIRRLDQGLEALRERGAKAAHSIAGAALFEGGYPAAELQNSVDLADLFRSTQLEAVRELIVGDIDATLAKLPKAMTKAERRDYENALRQKLREAESVEYNAVEAGRAAGLNVTQSAEMDPRILLGLI